MSFVLRDYQQKCIDNTFAEWEHNQAVLAVLATGLGKTEVFVQIANHFTERVPNRSGSRVLIICPQINLMEQAASKLAKRTGVMPDIEQAENRSNESLWGRNQFVVASAATLCAKQRDGSRRYQKFTDIGLAVFDEADVFITKAGLELIDHLKAQGVKILGVTATPQRHDKRAMGIAYDSHSFNYGIAEAVRDGWLVSAKHKCVKIESLDISTMSSSGTGEDRDFIERELADRMEGKATVCEIAEVTAREYAGLKTVVFCVSVEQARLVAERLQSTYNLPASWICANERLCTKEDRESRIRSFTTHDPDSIGIMCNVGILTTGWDFPGLEQIIMARVTRSKRLYSQIYGRGTRTLPGVVDFDHSTPITRRDAIALSAKPHFKMVDITDKNLDNKIITAIDVLGGNYSADITERAKSNALKKAAGEGLQGNDIDQDMLEAKRQLEQEKEEKRRAARAKVNAAMAVTEVEVDALNPWGAVSDIEPVHSSVRMTWGKYKGSSISIIPTDYLQYIHEKVPYVKPYLKNAIRDEIDRRKSITHISRSQGSKPANVDAINKLLAGMR